MSNNTAAGKGRGLGDLIHAALEQMGVTEERANHLLRIVTVGKMKICGCRQRQDQLNALGNWARRVLGGKTEQADEHLQEITKEQTPCGPTE